MLIICTAVVLGTCVMSQHSLLDSAVHSYQAKHSCNSVVVHNNEKIVFSQQQCTLHMGKIQESRCGSFLCDLTDLSCLPC